MAALNSELNRIAREWEQSLKEEIVKDRHIDSGDLLRSIRVSFKENNGSYDIKIQALEYIKYLDDGEFLTDWLKKKRVELKKILPKLIKQDIINQLKQDNGSINNNK